MYRGIGVFGSWGLLNWVEALEWGVEVLRALTQIGLLVYRFPVLLHIYIPVSIFLNLTGAMLHDRFSQHSRLPFFVVKRPHKYGYMGIIQRSERPGNG